MFISMRFSTVAATALAGTAFASSDIIGKIPNSRPGDEPASGLSCNYVDRVGCSGTTAFSPFGQAFADAGQKWTKELCMADSDGDGVTNG